MLERVEVSRERNHRRVTRRPCLVRVSLFSGDLAYPCHVVDLSPHGCRVRIPRDKPLDPVVRVLFPRLKRDLAADVVWRSDTHVGLRFRLGPPRDTALL